MRDLNEANVLEELYESILSLSQSHWRCLHANFEVKSKPLIGGCWGASGYRLSSMLFRGRLFSVEYSVTDDSGYLIFGSGSTAEGALKQARTVIHATPVSYLCAAIHEMRYWVRNAESTASKFIVERIPEKPLHIPLIPKRRIRIFEASNGKCHYCGVALELTGKWHIEHKMPKALMGSDEPNNLVASCAPCNLKKRDKTDIEFKAKRSAMEAV